MLKSSVFTKCLLAALFGLLVSAQSQAQLTWNWTYTSTSAATSGTDMLASGSGTFTTASTTSTVDVFTGYLVTAVSGTMTIGGSTTSISGVITPQTNFEGNDNLLAATFPQADINGIAFTSNGVQYNLFYGGGEVYTDPTVYGLAADDYSANGYQTGTFSAELSSVPEPSTYALIFGAAALGFALYRRRQAAA